MSAMHPGYTWIYSFWYHVEIMLFIFCACSCIFLHSGGQGWLNPAERKRKRPNFPHLDRNEPVWFSDIFHQHHPAIAVYLYIAVLFKFSWRKHEKNVSPRDISDSQLSAPRSCPKSDSSWAGIVVEPWISVGVGWEPLVVFFGCQWCQWCQWNHKWCNHWLFPPITQFDSVNTFCMR